MQDFNASTWTPVAVEDWESDTTEESSEPLGTKEKFWITDPEDSQWLFKFAREREERVRDEDTAECLVSLLAGMIAVPVAEIRLATCGSRRGVISRSVVPPGQRLEHGNELLALRFPHYDATRQRENPGYTVTAVKAALERIHPPPIAVLSEFRPSACGWDSSCSTLGSPAATATT